MSYGYRSVAGSDRRAYGRVHRYNQDVPALAEIAPNISGLAVDFDLDGQGFGASGAVDITVDWGDTNSDSSNSADSTVFAHTYGANDDYDVVVSITDAFGFTDQITFQVTVAA